MYYNQGVELKKGERVMEFYKEIFEQFCKANIAVGKAMKKAGGNNGKED